MEDYYTCENSCENCAYELEAMDSVHCKDCVHNMTIKNNFMDKHSSELYRCGYTDALEDVMTLPVEHMFNQDYVRVDDIKQKLTKEW